MRRFTGSTKPSDLLSVLTRTPTVTAGNLRIIGVRRSKLLRDSHFCWEMLTLLERQSKIEWRYLKMVPLVVGSTLFMQKHTQKVATSVRGKIPRLSSKVFAQLFKSRSE